MIILTFVIVLAVLYLGARLGGIGIGLAGGLGVLLLALLGIKPGNVPFDVIEIVMAVTVAISAVQAAGGTDYLVNRAEALLRHRPQHITFLAPLITYGMTLLSGTGHIALSTLPVIVNVAKSQGIRPSRPLSIAVVASQIAITASPLSAAFLFMAKLIAPFGIDYLHLLAITVPTTLAAVMLSATVANLLGCELENDPIYQTRLANGNVQLSTGANNSDCNTLQHRYAKRSLLLLLLGVLVTILYSIASSEHVGLIKNPLLIRNQAMVIAMLTVAALITWFCKVSAPIIPATETFKSGMSACICILGVAWLGDTFACVHLDTIKALAGVWLHSYPWLLAVALFLASSLFYSQAATAKALLPTAVALGVNPVAVIAAFPAVSGLFVLPTYPTVLAAVAMDDTGSTRIGRFVFNHPFLLPGVIAIVFSVLFSFLLAQLLL